MLWWNVCWVISDEYENHHQQCHAERQPKRSPARVQGEITPDHVAVEFVGGFMRASERASGTPSFLVKPGEIGDHVASCLRCHDQTLESEWLMESKRRHVPNGTGGFPRRISLSVTSAGMMPGLGTNPAAGSAAATSFVRSRPRPRYPSAISTRFRPRALAT
jgi:hypothetical protein